MIKTPPQKKLSRRILSSISQEATQKNIETQGDQQNRRSIRTEDPKPAKDRAKYQEHHRTDDDEIQSARDVLTRILTEQTRDDQSHANKTGDQRPHVRPGSKVMGCVLIIEDSPDSCHDRRGDRNTRRAGSQTNQEDQ